MVGVFKVNYTLYANPGSVILVTAFKSEEILLVLKMKRNFIAGQPLDTVLSLIFTSTLCPATTIVKCHKRSILNKF